MNNSKKFLRIILFLILFIPTYFAIYNIYLVSTDKFTLNNITKIEITDTNDRVLAEYTTSNDKKIYLNTLEKATEVSDASRDLGAELPLILNIYKGSKKYVYGLYLSLNENDCLIMTSEQELLLMDKNDANRILNTPLADMVYKNNRIPVISLDNGGTNLLEIYPKEGEWFIKKPDEKFHSSTVRNNMAASNKVKAYKDRDFELGFDIEPDMLYIEVLSDKEIIYSDIYNNFAGYFNLEEMKDLQYILTADWYQNETNDYYGKATYVLDVKYYVQAKIDITPEADVGDIAAIVAYNTGDDENLALATDTGYNLNFVTSGTNRVALIPVGLDIEGKNLKVTLTSSADDARDYHIKINEKDYPSKNISASKENELKHLSEESKAAKQAKYNEIFLMNSGKNEKYWTDTFAMPKEGKLLLDYGWRITINGGYEYINDKINIDIDPGNIVKASNAGKVIFAGEVPEDGNLIVIDHGMGIKTWYAHFSEINVKVGDGVLKGQQIGTMTKYTGLYTDILYNLHFAVSVNNVFVNPVTFIANGVPGIDVAIAGYSPLESKDDEIPEAADDILPEEDE